MTAVLGIALLALWVLMWIGGGLFVYQMISRGFGSFRGQPLPLRWWEEPDA